MRGSRNLREFLDALRRRGLLATVSAPVDADQEIAEIHRRVIAAGGPALLFTNVKGSKFPVVTNLFGTRERVDLAFGDEPLELVKQAVELAEHAFPPTLAKFWKARKLLKRGLSLGIASKRRAPVLEVIDEPARLRELPLLRLWPRDGGHFVTLPLVETRSPRDGKPNLGMYRMHRYDDTRTGMHWQIGKGGGFHYAEAEAMNQSLPVTVSIGGPPALILSAIAPLPEGIPEIILASFLLGMRLPRSRIANSALAGREVFAEAEFALIGSVAPKTRHPEGPFGDHYGYYSLEHPYPVFDCAAVAHRRDAIFPATIVGKPRQEDFFLGDYLQEMLSPLFPLVMPQVRALWSYGETGFHSLSAAIVRERYQREAMGAAFRILGEGQLSLTKFLLITDDTSVDLRDFPKLLEHILARCHMETDLYIFSHLSMDTLDYAGPEVNKGSKGVLLGLGESKRWLPRDWKGEPPAGTRAPTPFCAGCLVLGGLPYKEEPGQAARIAKDLSLKDWPLVVLCDRPEQAAAATINFLWTAFTRFEPAADLHGRDEMTVRRHVGFSAPVVLDARMKPWYPEEVFADERVAKTVANRWREFFPEGKIEMGSSDLAHLAPDRAEH